MNYPLEVAGIIKVLDEYKVNDELEEFNIFHLYPKDLAYPDGYYDARFFELVGFNTERMEKRNLGENKDSLWINSPIKRIYIYADGATLVEFSFMVRGYMWSQAPLIYNITGDIE